MGYKTVAALERRMSAHELMRWSVFEENFGPLTLHERMDAMMTQLAYQIHSSAGGKEPPEKFRPQWRTRRPVTGQGLADWFRSVAG